MAILAQQFAKIKKDDNQDKMMAEGSEQDKVQSDGAIIDERSPEEIKIISDSLADRNPMGELSSEQEAKIVLETITEDDVEKLFSDLGIERENPAEVDKSEKEKLNKAEFEKFKQDLNRRLPR